MRQVTQGSTSLVAALDPVLHAGRSGAIGIALLALLLVICLGGCGLTANSAAKQAPASSVAALKVATPALPSAQLQGSYQAALAASGGKLPYTWTLASGTLPTGISLTSATGTISGTPSQSGTFSFAVRVQDSSSPLQTASAPLTLNVSAAPGTLQITTTSLTNGQAQSAYQASLTASGGATPYSWSIASGALPAGLQLAASSGLISGTPTQTGTFSFTAKVSDSSSPAQSASGTVSITISAVGTSGPQITTSSLPSGQIGTAYQATITASGGATPYTWSISSGSLPLGIFLSSSSGVLSGTPTLAGNYTFMSTVKDSSGKTASRTFTIAASNSSSSALTVLTNGLNLGYVQQAYVSLLTATGGTAPYTWTLVSGSFPAGITLNNLNNLAGQLTGTPTASGQFSLGFQVKDSAGHSATTSLVLQIDAQQLDTYGGSLQVQCATTTGFFHLEKLSNRWWFCTPQGHGFWMEGIFDMASSPSITDLGTSYNQIAMQKYGDLDMTWGPQQVRRIKSWGFNSVAEFSTGWTLPIQTCKSASCPADWQNNGGNQPVPVPMLEQVEPSRYSLVNQNNYAPDAVKDAMYGINPTYYTGYRSVFPDIFDSNFDAWLNGEMQKDPIILPAENSPWVVGWISDESDELNGLVGAGPSMPTNPPGYNQRNQGLMTLLMSPVQTVNAGLSLVRQPRIYANPTVFTKAQLQTYLTTKYATISALNSSWSSAYTTFGSTGVQINREVVGTGNGTQTSFSKTLANHHVSPYTVLVQVNGVPVGGDCPKWIAVAPCSSVAAGEGSFTGPSSASPAISSSSAGVINYSTGAVTIDFATPPLSGTLITVNYIHDGWGYGTGLMDEDGRNSWIPSDFVNLGTNANFNGDMNGFLKALATHYFSVTSTRIRQYAPKNLYMGPGVLGTWNAPADPNVLAAAAPYVDAIAGGIDYTHAQAQLNFIATYLGDKPMIIWHGAHANPDSALWRYTNPGDQDCSPCNTQADRAAYYNTSVSSFPEHLQHRLQRLHHHRLPLVGPARQLGTERELGHDQSARQSL